MQYLLLTRIICFLNKCYLKKLSIIDLPLITIPVIKIIKIISS